MNKLKDIRSFDELKELIIQNKEFIKKAALPVTVAAALLFFWMFGGDSKDVIKEEEGTPSQIEEQVQEETNESVSEDIYVDISGCVNEPGVYKVAVGTRLFQLIDQAGGITKDADIQSMNRAEEVYDGQKIVVYSVDNKEDMSEVSGAESGNNKININRADVSQLQTIPGVGPVTAEKIIEYRKSNGRFATIEDLKKVSGIGEKTFEKLKDHITV